MTETLEPRAYRPDGDCTCIGRTTCDACRRWLADEKRGKHAIPLATRKRRGPPYRHQETAQENDDARP